MYTYPPDYSCNGPAPPPALTLDEQFDVNFIFSCALTILIIVPIFNQFHHTILDKTLEVFQCLQSIWNIFKGYYHIYKQLQHLCQETQSKDSQSKPAKYVQIRPLLQEQILQTCYQIQQPTCVPPPMDKFLTQARSQLYLPTPALHLFNPPVLCFDCAQKETTERNNRCQKFISQDLKFFSNNNKKKGSKPTSHLFQLL